MKYNIQILGFITLCIICVDVAVAQPIDDDKPIPLRVVDTTNELPQGLRSIVFLDSGIDNVSEAELEFVQEAIDRYSKDILADSMNEVLVTGRQILARKDPTIRGAGTVSLSDKTILVSVAYTRDFSPEAGGQSLQYTVHNEVCNLIVGSELERAIPMEWIECNDEDFVYVKDDVGFQGIRGLSSGPNRKYVRKGFVSSYGMYSSSEDFEAYWSLYFTNPKSFRQWSWFYPEFREKATILNEYLSVHEVERKTVNVVGDPVKEEEDLVETESTEMESTQTSPPT